MRVEFIANGIPQVIKGALADLGLAFVLEDLVEEYAWCPSIAGYHLYYPSRRQPSLANALVLKALRYQRG